MAHGVLYAGQTDGTGQRTPYALGVESGAVLWKHEGLDQIAPPVAVQ